MAHQISLLSDSGIVRVCHTGTMDCIDMVTAKDGSFFILANRGWNKILLNLQDVDIKVMATEVAHLFKDIDKTVPSGAYLAIVEPEESDFDYCRYAKKMSENWSRTRIEVFPEESAAMAWLSALPAR